MAKTVFVLFFSILIGCGGNAVPKRAGVISRGIVAPIPSPPPRLTESCDRTQVIQLDLVPLDKVYTVCTGGREVKVQLIHTVDESATLSTTDIVRLMSDKGYRQATDRELAALNDALEEGMAIISLDPVSDSGRKVKCPFIRMSNGVRTSSFIDNCNELFIRGTKFFIAMVRK